MARLKKKPAPASTSRPAPVTRRFSPDVARVCAGRCGTVFDPGTFPGPWCPVCRELRRTRDEKGRETCPAP